MSNDKPIWAPWRIEFISSEKDGVCFLCDKEQSSDSIDEPLVIARNEHAFVIANRYPYNPGHLLISPYRHVGDLTDLTPEERAALMETVTQCQIVLKELMNPNGFNVGFNLGVDGGAGVADHIHMHIVPRWRGDNNFMPVIAETRVVPEAIEETVKLLKEKWNELYSN